MTGLPHAADPTLSGSAAAPAHCTPSNFQRQQQQEQEEPTDVSITVPPGYPETPNLIGHQDADADLALEPSTLTFSDVPNDLLKLGPLDLEPQHLDDTAAFLAPHTPPSARKPTPLSRHNSYNNPRKPSPGLAARLKALGFGGGGSADRQSSLSPAAVGRLPEDTLRLLDERHQANSSAADVERRGRPWKGAGAPLQLLRSKSSRSSLFSRKDHDEEKPTQRETDTLNPPPEADDSAAEPDLLPEIVAAAPLDMDTNKYRLPDHTNGNGTKALSNTKQEHIEREVPPPPPPKDTPTEGTAPAEFSKDATSYFNPLGLQRPGSIYTISRLSFANQLAQLTSLQLPDAESLSGKISAIPTAQTATRALISAAEQIRMWIHKATDVIGGLDSDDDVEWAAAGGREGYEDVENAIARFEELINVYVSAIEELQCRNDINVVSGDDLQRAVTQMESILKEWAKVRTILKTAKSQVEIAMEWEELWDTVLGEIQNEMDDLTRLVFEMEERRHKSIMAAASGDNLDLGDLQTIVEENPQAAARNSRSSLLGLSASPATPATPTMTQDDGSLLALFARMQPLRASLDFLPMRLSVFETRASRSFPTACEELEERRTTLEAAYKKLEKDADSLRKELGEDKWILVFRSAGRQAEKMIESVDRSAAKLREAVDSGMHLTNPPVLGKKIESYEAKKMHYGPAIERVLSIIDRGVKDRLTVNGEILRLHTEMQAKWQDVKEQMKELDAILEEIQTDKRGQTLRDSISSLLSNDRSTIASGNETPGSSPPSSVVMSNLGLEPLTPYGGKSRSGSTGSHLPQPTSSRRSSLAPPSHITRRPVTSRVSTLSSPSPSFSTPSRSASATPVGVGSRAPRSTSNAADNRPRWNNGVNTKDSDVGHNFKPLTLTTPSPYAKRSVTPVRSRQSTALTPTSQNSKIPTLRTPNCRESTGSPNSESTPPRPGGSRMSFRERILSSPGPYAQQTLAARPRLSSQASMSTLSNRRASFHPPRPESQTAETRRSASSMATSRRTSMLPQPSSLKTSTSSAAGGSARPGGLQAGISSLRSTARKMSNVSSAGSDQDGGSKPRWRF
ncbi:cortical protein KAR9-domain-containing protein [Apiospora rasikravindrae]|uniref:Cortical protein KAR9-domain-containing protein n=1 Tax=Apiospora rasikravindrae TaxID=990691 RepID=A0ABR1UD14_9PEZI